MHSAFARASTILAVGTVLALLAPNVVHGDNATYKEHIKRAKAHAALDQFDKAAREFLAAYEIDPKPPLLFNAAHAFWLAKMPDAALEQYKRYLDKVPNGSASKQARARFFEAAELKWQARETGAALELYDTYIGLAPTNAERNIATAKLRFFEGAEVFWERDKRELAEPYYERYIALSGSGKNGTGKNLETARARLQELKETRERAAADKAAAEDKAKKAIEDASNDGDGAGASSAGRTDTGTGRDGYKIAFFSVAGLALIGVTSSAYNVIQLRNAEQEKVDAIVAVRDEGGVPDWGGDGGNACELARNSPPFPTQIQGVVDACDKGETAALLGNISMGVTAVSLAAAGFLFYKAYMQGGGESETSTATLVPSLSSDRVGAHLLVRF